MIDIHVTKSISRITEIGRVVIMSTINIRSFPAHGRRLYRACRPIRLLPTTYVAPSS